MRQYTTRERRNSENGDEYHFIPEDTFIRMRDGGSFASSRFYRIGWYGISYDELMSSDVAILSPGNIADITESHPEVRERFRIVYLDIPEEVRRKRLSVRYTGEKGDDNEERISSDRKDFDGFVIWDIRLNGTEDMDDFINNLSPKSGTLNV